VAPSLHDLPESWRERSPDDRELVYAMLAGGGSPRIVVELAAPDERPNLRPGPRLRGFHLRRSEDVVGTS